MCNEEIQVAEVVDVKLEKPYSSNDQNERTAQMVELWVPSDSPAAEDGVLKVGLVNAHFSYDSAEYRRNILEVQGQVQSRWPNLMAFLVGDINVEPYDAALNPLRTRFVDTWLQKHSLVWGTDPQRVKKASQRGFTGPAKDPRLRIDYIFMDRRDSQRLRDVRVLDRTGRAMDLMPLMSDHFPVVADVEV